AQQLTRHTVEPTQSIGSRHSHNIAVREVDKRAPLFECARFSERLPVVPGDRIIPSLNRAGQIKQWVQQGLVLPLEQAVNDRSRDPRKRDRCEAEQSKKEEFECKQWIHVS